MPKSTRRASLQAMQKMTYNNEVKLLMECTEEELLPCQKSSYAQALDEFTRVKTYIENVRSGKTAIIPLPNTTISTISEPIPVNNDPDIIVVGESLPHQKQTAGTTTSTVINAPPLSEAYSMSSDTIMNMAVPQQIYKFVNGQQSNVVKVGNQIFIRPMMTVAPQQNAPMLNMTHLQAAQNFRPMGPRAKMIDMESAKRMNKKEVDSSGNWVPLDEFYYGKKEGDPTYVEEKGEYRFKCWYCSKMLYNNVKAMMHMQGHIDSEKQQNLDLSDLTQCKHCYKQFDTPFEMQTHIEKVHLNNSHVLMCRICEKDHESRVALTSHMRQNHNACEMPYICQLCEFRSSMYSDVVDHFKKKHDSSENLLCLYCLRAFHVKFVLTGWGQTQNYYHHLLKHQSKNKVRKCQVCKLTFFNPQDLKAHRKKDHQANVKGVIGMNSKYTTPDQVMIKVPDQGLQPKLIKSLNAPAISKVRDNHLILPNMVNHVHCFECKMLMGTQDHYKKYIQCSMCRFATSCSFAYANHMMGFHSGQMTTLSLDIPKERPMEHVMYCMCGYASKYGNNIANHMVYCTKRTCYKDKPDVQVQDYDNQEIQDPRNKPGASLLDVLGLVKKPTPSLVEENEQEVSDEDEAAGSSPKPSTSHQKKYDWLRIKLQEKKPKESSGKDKESEEEMEDEVEKHDDEDEEFDKITVSKTSGSDSQTSVETESEMNDVQKTSVNNDNSVVTEKMKFTDSSNEQHSNSAKQSEEDEDRNMEIDDGEKLKEKQQENSKEQEEKANNKKADFELTSEVPEVIAPDEKAASKSKLTDTNLDNSADSTSETQTRNVDCAKDNKSEENSSAGKKMEVEDIECDKINIANPKKAIEINVNQEESSTSGDVGNSPSQPDIVQGEVDVKKSESDSSISETLIDESAGDHKDKSSASKTSYEEKPASETLHEEENNSSSEKITSSKNNSSSEKITSSKNNSSSEKITSSKNNSSSEKITSECKTSESNSSSEYRPSESESSAEKKTSSENRPSESKSSLEDKKSSENRPSESKSSLEDKTSSESTSSLEDKTLSDNKTSSEDRPSSENETSSKQKPVSEDKTSHEDRPSSQSKTSSENRPSSADKTSSENRPSEHKQVSEDNMEESELFTSPKVVAQGDHRTSSESYPSTACKSSDHTKDDYSRQQASDHHDRSQNRNRDYRDKDRSFNRRPDDYNRDRDRSQDYHYDRDRKYDKEYDHRGRDRSQDSRNYGYHGNQSNRDNRDNRDRRDGHRDRDRNRERDHYDNKNYGRSGRGHHGNYRDRNSYY